jgi:hypothetical protein
MNFLVKLHEVCRLSRTKFFHVDEVFVKIKEIENPGHPYDFVEVWVSGSGVGVTKKNQRYACHKKKNQMFMAELGNCAG